MQARGQEAGVYQRLLDETGKKVGITGLAFDDQGTCSLRIGGVLVILRRDLRLQGLLLFRYVAATALPDAPPLATGASLHPLLAGLPALCRLPEGDRLVCVAFLPLLECDPPGLLRLLARLVDWCAPAGAAPAQMWEPARAAASRGVDRL